jgi:hypothetical protein
MFDEDIIADPDEFDDYLSSEVGDRPQPLSEAQIDAQATIDGTSMKERTWPALESAADNDMTESQYLAQCIRGARARIVLENQATIEAAAAHDSTVSRLTNFQAEVEALDIEGQIADKLNDIIPVINTCAYSFVEKVAELTTAYETFEAASNIAANLYSGAIRGGAPMEEVLRSLDAAKNRGTESISNTTEPDEILSGLVKNSLMGISHYFRQNTDTTGFGISGAGGTYTVSDADNDVGHGPMAFMQNGVYFDQTHGGGAVYGDPDSPTASTRDPMATSTAVEAQRVVAETAGTGGNRSGYSSALPEPNSSDFEWSDPQVVLNYYLVLIAIQVYFCGVLKNFVGGQSSAGDFSNSNLGAILYLCTTYDDSNTAPSWMHYSRLWYISTMQSNDHRGDNSSSLIFGSGLQGPTGNDDFKESPNLLNLSICPHDNTEATTNIWNLASDAVTLALDAGANRSIASAARTFIQVGQDRAQILYEALQCIYDEWEKMTDLEDDITHQINSLSSFEHLQEGDYDAAALERYSRSVIEDVRSSMADLDDIAAVFYSRNPERQFFKEQCYLLTHIFTFAEHKKENIDRRVRSLSAIHSAGGDVDAGLALAVLDESSSGSELRQQASELEGDGYDVSISGGYSKKTLPYYGYNIQGPNYQEKYGALQFNSSLLIDGDPYAFLNKLVVSRDQGPLINIPNQTLQFLQPFIRLFKVEYDDNNNERDIEIKFDAYRTDFETMLYSTAKLRNSGVGLKSFEFTYDGDNPFGAKKSIKAQLKIFSNTFDELFVSRNDSSAPYRYIDLALKTLNVGASNYEDIIRENNELQKLNFRLKVQVGWSLPAGGANSAALNDLNMTEGQIEELNTALRSSIQTLNLIPTIHNFQIDDLGRVTLDIKYLAYIDELFDQARFNVFSEADTAGKRVIRNLEMKYFQGAGRCDSSSLREIKEAYASEVDEEVALSISELVDQMIKLDRIYYVQMDVEQIRDFVSMGPWSDASPPIIYDDDSWSSQLQTEINSALVGYRQRNDADDYNENRRLISASLAAINPDYQVLSFFYLSDLIDTLLANIEHELQVIPAKILEYAEKSSASLHITATDRNQKIDEYRKYEKAFRKLRYILGPVEFVKPNGESSFVNLGDIPISVKYWFEWLTSTMLDKEDSYYSLSNFMNDFLNKFVRQFLNSDRCFGYNIRQNLRMNQASVTGPQDAEYRVDPMSNTYNGFVKDPVTMNYLRSGVVRANIDNGRIFAQPVLMDTGDSDYLRINTYDEVNYMIYFVGRTFPTDAMCGVKADDERYGIYHYQIGRDRGLVKTVKLTKTSTPGLQEVRFEQQGYDGLEQLRVVYDAEIQSYANTNTYPGTYIFIEPKGFSPTNLIGVDGDEIGDLTKYGIGGYYMIIRSTHKYAPGEANSIIEAKWVNQIYCGDTPGARPPRQMVQSTSGPEDSSDIDCSGFANRASRASGA